MALNRRISHDTDSDSADTASLDPSIYGDSDSLQSLDMTPDTARSSAGPNTPCKDSLQPEGAFVNMGFMDSLEEEKLAAAFLESHITTTKNTVKQTQRQWVQYNEDLRSNQKAVKKQIQARKQRMIEMISCQAEHLESQLSTLMQSHEDNVQDMLNKLSQSHQEIEGIDLDVISNGTAGQETPRDYRDQSSRRNLETYRRLQGIRDKAQSITPIWLPYELQINSHAEHLMSGLFGSIQINDKEKYSLRLCSPISLVRKFSVKTKLDELPCGVVDMSVTSKGEVILADKQNKLIKMYDSDGKFMKIVGKADLRDPSRVTVLRDSGNILITDNHMKYVKLFDSNANFVKNFITDLKYPTSICETFSGDILISEFSTKCVIVLNHRGHHQYMFPTKLETPAHIACGPRGHVAVTDWKKHTVQTFNLSGEALWDVKQKGSGSKQLEQPQGVCFDPLGNIIIADTKNHRVQLMDEKGCEVKCILSKSDGIRLPMAVYCDNNGLLYVAEYAGSIKVFRYMERVDSDIPFAQDIFEPTSNAHTVSSEDVKLQDHQNATSV